MVSVLQVLCLYGAHGCESYARYPSVHIARVIAYNDVNCQSIGLNIAFASRLIREENFQTPVARQHLLNALLTAYKQMPAVLLHAVSPYTFPPSNGETSVTDAWRRSILHATVGTIWNYNASLTEKEESYELVTQAIRSLRDITPPAAYSVSGLCCTDIQSVDTNVCYCTSFDKNEADVHEPDYEGNCLGPTA